MSVRTLALVAALSLPATASAQWSMVDDISSDFVDISATGIALGLDDEGVAEIVPGFDLTQTLFTGDGSGRMWVSNNGAVGFLGDEGSVGAFWLNTTLPNFALFGGSHGTPQALAVYWDDLDSDTGEVYYETIGDPGSRVLIVQWQDRPHYSGDPILDGNEATFQLKIFENGVPGHAQFIYADVDFLDPAFDEGASATIGYQSNGIGDDVEWSFNTPGAVTAGTVLTLVGSPCPADFNNDGSVDAADLAQLLGAWGPCPGCPEDLTGDGQVDAADLAFLLGAWGPCT